MVAREALIVEASGERFRFYYDLEHPAILHIMLHRGTTTEDAVRTFFGGETQPWDETRSRFETMSETHGIYGTRHAHEQSVVIISCFKRGDD